MSNILHINIDGIDGSGKSTVSALLYETLRKKYPKWDILLIRESDLRRHRKSVRLDQLAKKYVPPMSKVDEETQLPWILARARDVEYFGGELRQSGIISRMFGLRQKPAIVIHDRSYTATVVGSHGTATFSHTTAYSYGVESFERNFKRAWDHNTKRENYIENFVLTLPPEVAFSRISAYRTPEDNESLSRLTNDSMIYDEIARNHSSRIDVSNKTPEQVVAQIVPCTDHLRKYDSSLSLEEIYGC